MLYTRVYLSLEERRWLLSTRGINSRRLWKLHKEGRHDRSRKLIWSAVVKLTSLPTSLTCDISCEQNCSLESPIDSLLQNEQKSVAYELYEKNSALLRGGKF
jgi:hypothetical protein